MKNVRSMFKVNNKDTRTTPGSSCFTSCSSVSIVNFEHVVACWKYIEIQVNKVILKNSRC